MTVFGRIASIALGLFIAAPVFPQSLPANAAPQDADPYEQPNVRKLAEFTVSQNAAILFTLMYERTGYARRGIVRWLPLLPGNSDCRYPQPALSHDARTVAYWSAPASGHCAITLFDLASGGSRLLLDLRFEEGPLTWSWDDSEIVFHQSTFPAAIQSVAVRDGRLHTLLPQDRLTVEGFPYDGLHLRFEQPDTVELAHSGDALLAGFLRCVPQKQPMTCDDTFRIAIAKTGGLSTFADGSDATISPIDDQVAWVTERGRIATVNLDGSDRHIVTRAPGLFGLFTDTIGGPLVWSPDGRHLIFTGTQQETMCTDNEYLVDIVTGHTTRLLHHSCITILDWREARSS